MMQDICSLQNESLRRNLEQESCTWPDGDIEWVKRPGKVIDLAVDREGNMWAVGKSRGRDGGNKVYKWDGNRWNYASIDGIRVAVDG